MDIQLLMAVKFMEVEKYRLSDDEREWVEIGKIPERRYSFGVASLNGRIYITAGWESLFCMINNISLYI